MKRKATPPALIGAFVLGAMVLLVAGILIFGAGGLLEEKMHFSLIFGRSVKGLRSGAPVNFRGVPIGVVSDIKVQVDPESLEFHVLVEIDIDGDAIAPTEGEWGMTERRQRYRVVDMLVEKGLRAQLQLQSLVTGQLMVDLDLHPEVPVRFKGGKQRYKELPTMPSGLDELTRTLSDMPIKQLVDTAIRTIEGIDKLVNAPETRRSLVNLDASMQQFQTLLTSLNTRMLPLVENMNLAVTDLRSMTQHLDSAVDPAGEELKQLADAARRTLAEADATLAAMSGAIGEDAPLYHELRQMLRETAAAARTLRSLTETLQERPDALLRGKSEWKE